MAAHQTLDLWILVRVQAPQPENKSQSILFSGSKPAKNFEVDALFVSAHASECPASMLAVIKLTSFAPEEFHGAGSLLFWGSSGYGGKDNGWGN
jgi:hypothetical protein